MKRIRYLARLYVNVMLSVLNSVTSCPETCIALEYDFSAFSRCPLSWYKTPMLFSNSGVSLPFFYFLRILGRLYLLYYWFGRFVSSQRFLRVGFYQLSEFNPSLCICKLNRSRKSCLPSGWSSVTFLRVGYALSFLTNVSYSQQWTHRLVWA